jgi:hypothetical protein
MRWAVALVLTLVAASAGAQNADAADRRANTPACQRDPAAAECVATPDDSLARKIRAALDKQE